MWRAATVGLPAQFARLAAVPRDPGAVTSLWTDAAPLGPEIAIFAHHHPAGAVSAETLGYLDALRDAGRTVLFASNAGRLAAVAEHAVRARCAGVLTRANAGHDFSAWRAAMLRWNLPRADTRTLLLANDSTHGPLAPLGPTLAAMDFSRADVWALTDSAQRGPHLQSYFVLAGPAALRHPAWARFWAGVRPVRSREWAIVGGELRFSRAMAAGGLRLAAVWPHDVVLARFLADPAASGPERAQRARVEAKVAAGDPVNASIDLWRALLRLGCPLVKRDLTGRNRGRVADVAEIARELSRR